MQVQRAAEELLHPVVEHREGRHEQHQDGRGEEDAEAEADGHRDEELRLEALLQNQRQHPQERRQRSQHDGAEAHLARLADSLGHRDAGSSSFVDEVDEHERVVDHHTAEADDAEGLL